jgi:rhomboid family GlyGly-CTERM serine protease
VAAAVLLTAAARDGAIDPLLATAEGVRAGQLWRLITGSLVHATWGHLVRDLALLVFVGVAYGDRIGRHFGWLYAAGLAIPAAAVFVFEPDISIYYGTSGLTHALLAAAVAGELRQPSSPSLRLIALIIAVVLGAKLGFEVITGDPMFPMDLGHGVRQLPIAHAAGAAVGAGFAIWSAVRGDRTRDHSCSHSAVISAAASRAWRNLRRLPRSASTTESE